MHVHDYDCIESDIMDLGDDGDGYVAYDIFTCKVTGESHSTYDGFDLE